MDARNRRRKLANESKKNASNTSYLVAGISAASIAYFVFSVVYGIESQGTTPKFVGAIGMLFFLGTIVCIVIGKKQFDMKNYNLLSRIVGIVVPIVSVSLWSLLYIVGLIFAI